MYDMIYSVPDNIYLPLNVLTSERISSSTFMLCKIRSLINKLSESKLGIDKIFGMIDSDLRFQR
jgi:hypothetical protein